MSARYAGEAFPPKLFAVVEVASNRVVARGLASDAAQAFAKQWARQHGRTVSIPELIAWSTDAEILQQLLQEHQP